MTERTVAEDEAIMDARIIEQRAAAGLTTGPVETTVQAIDRMLSDLTRRGTSTVSVSEITDFLLDLRETT